MSFVLLCVYFAALNIALTQLPLPFNLLACAGLAGGMIFLALRGYLK